MKYLSDLTGKCREFCEACIIDNSVSELEEALEREADTVDMREWGITPAEWFDAIRAALLALGAHPKQIRKELNLSVNELADIYGVSGQTIKNIEQGAVEYKQIYQLAGEALLHRNGLVSKHLIEDKIFYPIEIGTDSCDGHEEAFRDWLNERGHLAHVGRTTGSYVDGVWTSESSDEGRHANEVLNSIWSKYCRDSCGE